MQCEYMYEVCTESSKEESLEEGKRIADVESKEVLKKGHCQSITSLPLGQANSMMPHCDFERTPTKSPRINILQSFGVILFFVLTLAQGKATGGPSWRLGRPRKRSPVQEAHQQSHPIISLPSLSIQPPFGGKAGDSLRACWERGAREHPSHTLAATT